MWIGPSGGDGSTRWATMPSDLKNRDVADVCIVCCDGLKGLADSIRAIWPEVTVQICVVHLVRNSLRLSSRKDWQKLTTGLRRIYTAPTVTAAEAEFADFTERWDECYPAMINTWRNAWDEFAPFLEFPPEVRKLIYITNAIESLNARFRVATKRRGHFPDEQSALEVLDLAIRHREKNKGNNPAGRVNGWQPTLNVLSMTYGDRLRLN